MNEKLAESSGSVPFIASPSRRWLVLGLGSAAVLAVGGGVALSLKPGFSQGKLQKSGRAIFGAVLPAVVGELLPVGSARGVTVEAGLDRVEGLIGNLPLHAQAELAQLLSLLGTTAGRYGLVGLQEEWDAAPTERVRAAMQSMRTSTISLKQQAYLALHNLSAGAYFADASTWVSMGYPGPLKIS